MDVLKNSSIVVITPANNETSELYSQLSKHGFKTLSVSCLEIASKCIETIKAGVILIDLDMFASEIESYSVVKSIVNNRTDLPVIIISSKIDIKFKLQIFKLGIDDYIVRPFETEELCIRINIHIEKYWFMNLIKNRYNELEKKNKALIKLATVDALTGLYNKRYILDRLCSEVSRSARFMEPLSFIMIDIDFFKKINDRHGHPSGDKLLNEFANILRQCIRNIDIPARYGGEEFLIACPNTDSTGAAIIAERLRKKMQATIFHLDGKTINITLSIGIRSVLLDPGSNIKDIVLKLIDEADKALYTAKAKGRNRVEIYKEAIESIPRLQNNNISYRLKERQYIP